MSKIKTIHISRNGKLQSCILEKSILSYNEEAELNCIKLKITVDGVEYVSSKEFTGLEYAVIDIQKQLPDFMKIACCQTCKYGNFCPFGDVENEIFCFMAHTPKDKMDVVDIFSTACDGLPKHDLLFWCRNYQMITDGYYTYNDWDFHFKNKDS